MPPKNITDEVCISRFTINSTEFNNIIKLSHNCPNVWITASIIISDKQFDFKIPQIYKTKLLGFHYTGNEDRSNWGKNKKQLNNILKAASLSGLKQSLTCVNVCGCNCKTEEVQKYVTDKIKMKNVIISDQKSFLKCTD